MDQTEFEDARDALCHARDGAELLFDAQERCALSIRRGTATREDLKSWWAMSEEWASEVCFPAHRRYQAALPPYEDDEEDDEDEDEDEDDSD